MGSEHGRGASGQGLSSDSEADPGSVHVLLSGHRTRIVLEGSIDAGIAPDLLEAAGAAEEAGKSVEVDAHHVTFMDSTGLSFLARLAARSHGRVALIRPPAEVRFLVRVTNVEQLVDILDDDPGFDYAIPWELGDTADDDAE
jgi:anti-sigma B factor antagonist